MQEFFRVSLNLPDGVPGIVMAIQTFGDYAKWNPHLHAIVADGLFTELGTFHVMPEASLKPLAERFRAVVFRELRDRGLFFIRWLYCLWQDGFFVIFS
ncbi:MAG: transposase [Pseudomonadota bacterium]|nr:transposase [Pseudomonadota bacterium]